jgi:hypothetical protein
VVGNCAGAIDEEHCSESADAVGALADVPAEVGNSVDCVLGRLRVRLFGVAVELNFFIRNTS